MRVSSAVGETNEQETNCGHLLKVLRGNCDMTVKAPLGLIAKQGEKSLV